LRFESRGNLILSYTIARVLCFIEAQRREIIFSLDVKCIGTISKELNVTVLVIRVYDVITQNMTLNMLFHT